MGNTVTFEDGHVMTVDVVTATVPEVMEFGSSDTSYDNTDTAFILT